MGVKGVWVYLLGSGLFGLWVVVFFGFVLEVFVDHEFDFISHEMVDLYFFVLILEFFSEEFSFELKVFDCLKELEFLEFLVEDFFLHLESFFSGALKGLEL